MKTMQVAVNDDRINQGRKIMKLLAGRWTADANELHMEIIKGMMKENAKKKA